MKKYRYCDDWKLNDPQVILPEHASGYVKRVVNERRKRNQLNNLDFDTEYVNKPETEEQSNSKLVSEIPKDFDYQTYLDNYPDLRKNGIDNEEKARQHWLNYGRKEGRNYKKNDFLYIFLHVPKTGGTTLASNLMTNFDKEELLRLYPEDIFENLNIEKTEDNYYKVWSHFKNYLNLLTDSKKDKIKVIYGHLAYYGIHRFFHKKTPRYITILRNPVSLVVSYYNFFLGLNSNQRKYVVSAKSIFSDLNKILPFEAWFDGTNAFKNTEVDCIYRSPENPKINLTSLEKLEISKENLNKFYFVGLTENPQDFLFIYKLLGIKKFDISKKENVSKKYFVPEDYEKFKREISLKCKLDYELYNYAKELNKEFKNMSEEYKILMTFDLKSFTNDPIKEANFLKNIPEDFDYQTYLDNYPDLRKNGIDNEEKARQHWLNYGRKEERIWKKLYNPDPSNLNNP